MSKGKNTAPKADRSILIMMASVVLIFLAAPYVLQYYTVENAATKPFNDFESFYPYYISQHQDTMCRRLHIVGTSIIVLMALFDPFILPSLLMAAMVGYTTFTATKNIEHGIFEMFLMLATFQMFMRRLTGNWMKGLGILIVAYSFAWVGHFYFEHNKPATFIYPVFSLAGDLRMWFEVIARQRAF